jgi:hypothetical protein
MRVERAYEECVYDTAGHTVEATNACFIRAGSKLMHTASLECDVEETWPATQQTISQ